MNSGKMNVRGACECPRLGKDFNHQFGRWGDAHLGEHDMASRKMNRCRPEKKDTKEHG